MKRWNFDKPLAKLTTTKDNAQINEIRDEKGAIIINTDGVQKVNRTYLKYLGLTKMENLKMDKSLDMYDLPKSNQEKIYHLNRL